MGAATFLNRARTELLAAGGTAPESTPPGLAPLTRQETRIAQLASQGLTNHQIAAQLFLSPNTGDYHLRKVFRKLNINRRGEIQNLPGDCLQATALMRTPVAIPNSTSRKCHTSAAA
jgi:DNA-binding CsgD family transcriptional regulator